LPPNTHVTWSFSTRGMAPEERLAALRGLSEQGTLPIEPLPGCVAEADVRRRTYGNVGILLGRLGGLRQVIAPNAPDFAEEVFLGVSISGVAVVSHRGREMTRESGGAVLLSRPEAGFISSRPMPGLFLGLRAPRRSLAPLVTDLSRDSLWAIPPESHSLRLLIDYVRLISRSEAKEPAGFGHAIATHVLDLIAVERGRRSRRRSRGGGTRRASGASASDQSGHLEPVERRRRVGRSARCPSRRHVPLRP
jgi:hypothetical protein